MVRLSFWVGLFASFLWACAPAASSPEEPRLRNASLISIDPDLLRDGIEHVPGGIRGARPELELRIPLLDYFRLIELDATGRSRVPTPDGCVVETRPSASTPSFWLEYAIHPFRHGISRVRVCEQRASSRNCFHDIWTLEATRTARIAYGSIAAPVLPAVHLPNAPMAQAPYKLVIDTIGGQIWEYDLTAGRMPLPELRFEGDVRVAGPATGAGQRFFRVHYASRNVDRVRLMTVVAGSGISFEENATTIASTHTAPLEAVEASGEWRSDSLCVARNFTAEEWDAYRRWGLPFRLQIHTPDAEGCTSSAVTTRLAAVDGTYTPRGEGGRPPYPPSDWFCPSNVSEGGIIGVPGGGSVGGGGGDTVTCADEGTRCMYAPPECNGPDATFSVEGRIECRGGEPECVAEAGVDYCNGPGTNCGGATNDACRVDTDCAHGLVCDPRARIGCDSRYEVCGMCRIIESWPGYPCPQRPDYCYMPKTKEGTWPGDTENSDICIPNDCTPHCPGECGHDGCGGSCGTCDKGERCVAAPLELPDSPYGALCLADDCKRDSDCACPDGDDDCKDLGHMRCVSGHCTRTF